MRYKKNFFFFFYFFLFYFYLIYVKQVGQEPQHIVIRYKNSAAFQFHHSDCYYFKRSLQFICSNFRVKFAPISLNGQYHTYQFIEKECKIFNDISTINKIRNITSNLFQTQESKDEELSKLRADIWFINASFVNVTLIPLIKKAFNQIHNRFRILLWGFINPNIKYEKFLNQRLKELIRNEDGKITTIDIPKHGGNLEIDETLRKFVRLTSEYSLKPYGYSSTKIISAEGKGLHQFSFFILFYPMIFCF